MKKFLISLSICLAIFYAFTGCGSNKALTPGSEAGYTINQTYDEDNLLSVTGKKMDLNSSYYDPFCMNCGFTLLYTDTLNDLYDNFYIFESDCWHPYQKYGYYPDVIAKQYMQAYEIEDDEEYIKACEEINAKAAGTEETIMVFGYKDPNNAAELAEIEELTKDMDVIEIGSINGNDYFFAFAKDVPENDLYNDTDIANIQSLIDDKKDILDHFAIYTPIKDEIDFSDFTVSDVYGNEVTEEIFKDYDLTMVNIWATWCGGCIEEMPDLVELYDMLPKNVNLISICGSYDYDPSEILETVENNKLPFTTITYDENFRTKYDASLIGYPTTFFVDNNGNLVGRFAAGAPYADDISLAESYIQQIEAHLAMVNN